MVASAYDAIAEWYDAWAGATPIADDPFFPAAESLMGDVAEKRICDLACGQGRVARYLAERGAAVVGIDLSAKLLAIARRHEESAPHGIEYRQADAQSLDGIADGSFDGIVCFMALMDIPDLASTLHSVARILVPGGWFVFAIIHPCYNPPLSGESETPTGVVRTIKGYFDEGYWRSEARTGPPGKVGAYHRTLSTYVNVLTEAGLIVTQLCEPQAAATLAARRPVWAEVPAVLIARCLKSACIC
jgi:2-polyprenyl-3-methyl-5-hydroxy-6-metoxy-1,4-benzoquinol methylase